MEESRVAVEGSSLEDAINEGCKALDVTGEHELEYEYDKAHFAMGADTVRIFVWTKDPVQMAAVRFAVEFTEQFMEKFGVRGGHVTAIDDEGKTILSISAGDDANLLIGQDGKNLDALQHVLANAMAHAGHEYKIVLDVEAYRSRREARLREQTEMACRKTIDLGEIYTIGPFNSYERRIIHMVVLDTFADELESQSVGTGKTKKIEIIPK
jgi:predicted RNA-binding protein Jag